MLWDLEGSGFLASVWQSRCCTLLVQNKTRMLSLTQSCSLPASPAPETSLTLVDS